MATTNSINLNSNGVVGYNTSTGVFTATAMTQYYTLTGGSTAQAINQVAPSATSGVPLVSGGSSAQPAYGTAVVAGGGTGATTLTGVLTGNGTSAVTANAVSQYYVLLGGSSNAVSEVASPGTSGQVLTSNGNAANPSFQTFTPTAQSPYLNQTTASVTMAVNTGYVTNDAASLVTYTIPSTFAVGTIFAVAGNSADGWSINLATNGITANVGNIQGTTAIASTNQYDSIKLVATVANSTVTAIAGFGNWSVS